MDKVVKIYVNNYILNYYESNSNKFIKNIIKLNSNRTDKKNFIERKRTQTQTRTKTESNTERITHYKIFLQY
jgi:hypothetical protein